MAPSDREQEQDTFHFGEIDWLPNPPPPPPPQQQQEEQRRESDMLEPPQSSDHRSRSSPGGSSPAPASLLVVDDRPNGRMPELTFVDEKDRTVSRKLRGIHVFMITISGVLGVGLYVRSGSILRIGGPAAVLISFSAVGLLAWMVMQCIGEMLALWPISGALVEFVGTWVDEELGTTVGIAYWFTYSINFAAIIVAAAGEVDFWDPGKAIQGTILFFVVPALLVLFNSFGVRIYGLTEVIGGSLKLLGALIVIISMIVINVGAGKQGHLGTTNYKDGTMFPHDKDAADSWVAALFISFSIAAFAFIGVEITAATALEARPDTKTAQTEDGRRTGRPFFPRVSVRFSATWTSFIAWVIYFVGGFVMTLNVSWDDDRLPQAGWLGSPVRKMSPKTDSGFVISAASSGIPGLADMFTAVLLITALTAANTNLYVASRTLFGLTRKLDGNRWRWLAFFGRTNNYQVPVRAMFISCFFLWVPFLYLSPNNSPNTTIASLLEVLSQMGSVSCLVVWTCECWAFIRFYNCMKLHQDELKLSPQYAHVCRFRRDTVDDHYPWRSHGQPVTMYLAVAGCLFILIVADGAALWRRFYRTAFLSAYLAPLCFIALFLFLKAYRSGGWRSIKWELEDLSSLDEVKFKIRKLDEIKYRATARDEHGETPGWGNLWGRV